MAANPSRLYHQLQNTGVQNKDTPMYQFLRALVDATLSQFNIQRSGGGTPVGPIPPDISGLDFLTHSDESTDLPNSRNLLAGTNITFDDSVANERTVNASGGTADDYVVLSDGATGGSTAGAGAKVYFDTNITITDSVQTIIDWTDEQIDEDSFWAVGNPSRFTIPSDGWYTILGQVTVIAASAGQAAVAVIVDGTTEIARFDNFFTPVNNATQVAISVYLTAGQYVELEVLIISSDPTTDILAGQHSSWFEIFRPGIGSIAPSPVNDGFGNFIYVPYTP